jgi:hypothetical protein
VRQAVGSIEMSYWRIQDQLHARRILIHPPSSDTCQTIATNTVRAIHAVLAICAVPAVFAVRAAHTVSAIPTVRTISAEGTTHAINTARAICAFCTPTAVCAVCAIPAVLATPASTHVVAVNALLASDHQSRADNSCMVVLRSLSVGSLPGLTQEPEALELLLKKSVPFHEANLATPLPEPANQKRITTS